MATPTTRDPPAASSPRSGQQAPARAQRQAYRRRKARAKAHSEARRQEEAGRVEALPVKHPHAAGIHIGSRSHWVCVGFTTEAASCLIREFPAHMAGLQAIAAFLREHQVNSIALESTGIYWIPLYELLQAEGIEVLLVDPSYSHQLRGRPKTDRRDCQWIYRLHSVGLLAAAFRPDEKTCQLRTYLRQRANLIRQASRHVQHMQKALEQMNLKLTNARARQRLADLRAVDAVVDQAARRRRMAVRSRHSDIFGMHRQMLEREIAVIACDGLSPGLTGGKEQLGKAELEAELAAALQYESDKLVRQMKVLIKELVDGRD